MKDNGLIFDGKRVKIKDFPLWHWFSLKKAGNMSFKYGETARRNLRKFFKLCNK